MFKTRSALEGALKQRGSTGATIKPAHTCGPVLLLLHQKSSCAGAVGDWLLDKGYQLDIKRPTLGEKLPPTLENHAGIIAFGGPMSANDDTPEVIHEIDWLSLTLKQKKPYFGICLGAQMMVRQLGGEVRAHKRGLVEIGYHQIEPTKAGTDFLAPWPKKCFQWHKEGFSLPSGTVKLAGGLRFANQAYSYDDRVFGVQFHPETTTKIINRWSNSASHMLTKKGAHIRERLLSDHLIYKKAQRDWLHLFLDHWTSLF